MPAVLIGGLTLAGGALTLLLPDTSHTYLPDTVLEITVDAVDNHEKLKAANHVTEPLLTTERVSSV